VKGATKCLVDPEDIAVGFNPRAREGRDVALSPISPDNVCFNPRAREGRDMLMGIAPDLAHWFQSTRP